MCEPDIYRLMAGLRRRCPCNSGLGARVRQVGEGVVAVEKVGLGGIAVDGDEAIVEESRVRTVEIYNAVCTHRGRLEKLEYSRIEAFVRSI